MIHRDLNRRLLWAHCLSKKIRGPNGPAKVADACCGIQSQNLRESFTSFWTRIDGFKDGDVSSELKPGGSLVKTWAVRSTLHTIPSKDYYIYIYGGASERMLQWIDTIAKKRNYPSRDERRRLFYEPILKEIKGKTVAEPKIRDLANQKARKHGLKEHVWSGVGEMAFLGLLVYAGKEGSARLWMRSDEWLPRPKRMPDRRTCRTELVRKYISRHGPVSRDDIMYWSYLTRSKVDQALTELQSEIIELSVQQSEEKFFSLDQDIEREFPPPPKAIILPKYDSLLLSLKEKARFMDMAYYKRIFPKLPVGMVDSTFLLDGFVAGTWRKAPGKPSPKIEAQAFKKLTAGEKAAVEQRLSEYCEYAGVDSPVRWVRST